MQSFFRFLAPFVHRLDALVQRGIGHTLGAQGFFTKTWRWCIYKQILKQILLVARLSWAQLGSGTTRPAWLAFGSARLGPIWLVSAWLSPGLARVGSRLFWLCSVWPSLFLKGLGKRKIVRLAPIGTARQLGSARLRLCSERGGLVRLRQARLSVALRGSARLGAALGSTRLGPAPPAAP